MYFPPYVKDFGKKSFDVMLFAQIKLF